MRLGLFDVLLYFEYSLVLRKAAMLDDSMCSLVGK
jgi:hypothetical protein